MEEVENAVYREENGARMSGQTRDITSSIAFDIIGETQLHVGKSKVEHSRRL